MKVKLNLTPKEKQIFLKELTQHINDIENCLVNLEQQHDTVANIEQLFRSFHTIKGNAGIAEYEILKKLAHEIENTLQKFRSSNQPIPDNIADLLFKSVDIIKSLRVHAENPKDDIDEASVIALMEEFKLVTAVKEQPKETTVTSMATQFDNKSTSVYEVHLSTEEIMPAVRLFQVLNVLTQAAVPYVSNPTLADIQAAKVLNPLSIYIDQANMAFFTKELIDQILSVDGVVAVKKIMPVKTYPKQDKDSVANLAQNTQEELQDIQINIKKLDSIINLLGEVLIDRNKIAQNILLLEEKYTLDPQIAELLDLVNHLGKITYNLQTELLNIRTIPLNNIVGKYPRLVRELAKNLGKKVRLEITGQEVELDRSILKYLNDMLIHMIRNAVDHGIETPDERMKHDKKDTGVIKIDAFQKNNKAYFIITDDGKGLDPQNIRKIILEKGMLDTDTVNSLSNAEIIKYICQPGFSTKKEVSEFSGRGVGMDVVQNTIQKLGGQMTIESELGKGTQFRIILPLTLAIVQGLVTTTNNRTFIIPISYVDEVVRSTGKEIKDVNKKPHLMLRGNLIPLINLKSLLYNKEFNMKNLKKLFIVIVNYNDQQTGILVDKLVGEEEIVIKNIDYASDKYYIIHAATIMGTGEIGLILDIASLLDYVVMKKNKQITPQEKPAEISA
ncbi:MAG: chemotaxis protein CheA [Candidatus Margulisbacteria bacterium]|nr:chemotaxis protein CheA [Candidatus Margulisiibacteriota bacterium]